MEYSIFDALRAGFTKVVFIIKPDMRDLMENMVGHHLAARKTADGDNVEVCYAYQDFSSVPDFYTVPSERVKPFGTVHALLCAREFVHEPFVVINADDYYGVDAFKTIYAELSKLAESGEGTMVGYDLCTAADTGSHREPLRHGHARRVPCERTGDARPRGRNVPPKALRRRQDPRHSGKRRRPGLRARDAGLDELLGLYAVAV